MHVSIAEFCEQNTWDGGVISHAAAHAGVNCLKFPALMYGHSSSGRTLTKPATYCDSMSTPIYIIASARARF